ncbi:MAG: hypothetical protein Q4D62_10955 [Planctomycetia bacterium]|nr:hypothetical protein [Planctomycetia bacterium]
MDPPKSDSAWLQAMKVPNVPAGIDGNGVTTAIIDDSVYMDHSWYKENLISGITLTGTLSEDDPP